MDSPVLSADSAAQQLTSKGLNSIILPSSGLEVKIHILPKHQSHKTILQFILMVHFLPSHFNVATSRSFKIKVENHILL